MKFAEMTFPELKRVDRAKTVVVAPIAACEQHSHHLATITDTVLVSGVADGVESGLPSSVLLLPTLWLGAAPIICASAPPSRPTSIRMSTSCAISCLPCWPTAINGC